MVDEFVNETGLTPEQQQELGRKGMAKFPEFIYLPVIGRVPVTWTKYDYFNTTIKDELGNNIPETRDIYVPVLPMGYSYKSNLDWLLKNYTISATEDEQGNIGDIRVLNLAEQNAYSKSEKTDYESVLKSLQSVSAYYSVFNTAVDKGIVTQDQLNMPGVNDFLKMQVKKILSGSSLSPIESDEFAGELNRIIKFPDYEKRLRMIGKLPSPSEQDYRNWYELDRQRGESMRQALQGEQGGFKNEIEQWKSVLSNAKPFSESWKTKEKEWGIKPENLIGLQEQAEYAGAKAYEFAEQRLKDIESGKIKPFNMSQEEYNYAQKYGTPLTTTGATAQRYMSNPASPEFMALPMGQRQELTRVGQQVGGGETFYPPEVEAQRKVQAEQAKIKTEQEQWKKLHEKAVAYTRTPQRVTRI